MASQAMAKLLALGCFSLLTRAALSQPGAPTRARIVVDAHTVEGHFSPMLYGQFMEFMYEDIKGGLYAELIRNRSFEEPATYRRTFTVLGAGPGRPR